MDCANTHTKLSDLKKKCHVKIYTQCNIMYMNMQEIDTMKSCPRNNQFPPWLIVPIDNVFHNSYYYYFCLCLVCTQSVIK